MIITTKEKRIITNEDLHDMIVDSFDRFFNVMDENNKELKKEITTQFKIELKKEISELRSEMNQRFFEVDNRFLSIDKRLLKIIWFIDMNLNR